MSKELDEKLKKRIYVFYFAGLLNLVLGFWVLFYGGELEQGTRTIMMLFFFGFAAVDFWMPQQMKRKYAEFMAESRRLQREQAEKAAAEQKTQA
ncbi:MAG: hypothetical protein KF804_08845 [Burkholderiales bacterium]|nr:hypothetical protein [Burkholderiales bacterium]